MLCTYLNLAPADTDGPIYLAAPPAAVIVPCPNDAQPDSDRCALHAGTPDMTLAEVYEPLATDPEPYESGPTTILTTNGDTP